MSYKSEYKKKWYEKHPEKMKQYNDNRNDKRKEWYVKNKDKIKDRQLKSLYGISLEEYMILVEQTGGVCPLCNTEFVLGRKSNKNPVVDHNHKTGKIRGIICGHCNSGLGCFKDNVNILGRAIKYLGGL